MTSMLRLPSSSEATKRGSSPRPNQWQRVQVLALQQQNSALLSARNASVNPPSTGITWPVVQRARGLARKRIASAQSAGSIALCVNVRSA